MKGSEIVKVMGKQSILELIACLQEQANVRLALFQKIILSEIGSVETLLNILVPQLEFTVVRQVPKPDDTFFRESVFKNGFTEKIMLSTETTIFCSNLPQELFKDIIEAKEGIGSAIQKHKFESRREILYLEYDESNKKLSRVYDLIINNKLCFRIREVVPTKNWKDICKGIE